MRYFQTFSRQNSCSILVNQTINRFVLSRTKCHSLCFKVMKKSRRYLLLFESNKEFKIGSYFSDTLYFIQITITKILKRFLPDSVHLFHYFAGSFCINIGRKLSIFMSFYQKISGLRPDPWHGGDAPCTPLSLQTTGSMVTWGICVHVCKCTRV